MLRTLFAVLATILTYASTGQGKEAVFTLHPQEPWGNVFGGKQAVFHVSVTSQESARGTVSWQFAGEGRTIARGEQAVDVAPSRPSVVEIKLAVPAVKEGVVMPASLALALTRAGADKAVVEATKPLWIFPEDPFAGKAEWLKKLNIQLFDPAGKTAALFTKIGIPFKETHNVDAFAEFKDSVLIIAEGVSMKEYRGLTDMMVKAAAAGIPVLCLAPADGSMRLPGSAGSDQPHPSAISLKQAGIITELDKRLDAEGWAPDGKLVSSRLALQGDRTGVWAAVTQDDSGWVWVDMRFGEGKGRIVVCGFVIVSKWNESPTPRFLFEKVLVQLVKEK